MNKIFNESCLNVSRNLEPKSVNTIVTSPPYFGLRDYGVEGQIGLEQTPQAYVDKLVSVFRACREVLRDDGTLWLNLGDSYYTQPPGNKPGTMKSSSGLPNSSENLEKRARQYHRVQKLPGLKLKDLIGIPWRVAFALQADGWYLRQDIIWHKPNPMPESVKDRCTKAHEYIFLLSKNPKYYFDSEAIKQEAAESTKGRGAVSFGGEKGRNYKPEKGDTNYRAGNEQWGRVYHYTEGKVNRRDVWTVATKPCKEAHFATFPPDLIRPCILAGAPKHGVVLDPFMGAGTTAMVCKQEHRQYVGFELNPAYIEIANRRIAAIPDELEFEIEPPKEDA